MPTPTNLPEAIYWFVGILVLANVASIISVFTAAMKILWWASKIDFRVESGEKVQVQFRLELDEHKDELTELRGMIPHRHNRS